VSIRLATRVRSSLSKSTAGSAGLRRTGSPSRRMGVTVTGTVYGRATREILDARTPRWRSGGQRLLRLLEGRIDDDEQAVVGELQHGGAEHLIQHLHRVGLPVVHAGHEPVLGVVVYGHREPDHGSEVVEAGGT